MTEQEILDQTRTLIRQLAGDDPDKWWYANRFVFARLQLDERKTKTHIKKRLFESNVACHACGRTFESRANAHLHRLDDTKGYSDANCVLMHPECHRKWHAEKSREVDDDTEGLPSLLKSSKRYEGKSFLYWWDIWPNLAESLCRYGVVEFICKDTLERCIVPTSTVERYLTPDRQTSRGQGNWGIRVLKDHPREIAFEPGTEGSDWEFLPVTWFEESED